VSTDAPTLSFNRELQGLRALAVAVVVAYHANVPGFGGGYVGVDVFFVVSGYLITALLVAEYTQHRRIDLVGFYARRFRRLLPASTLVLLVTVAASTWWWDPLRFDELRADALRALAFVANIGFAAAETDYLAAELDPSPLQHFWSLAVEEQFYAIWPLLVFAACRIGRRPRLAVAAVAAAVVVVSGVYSLHLSATSRPAAYFLLPSRAWELALGALLAATPAVMRLAGPVRAALGWVGMCGVALAVVTFDERTAFPAPLGALPVVATVLVLLAGSERRGPSVVLATRVGDALGTRSYAVYLWHWPVLVLAASSVEQMTPTVTVAALAGVLALSWGMYRWVENPVRHAPLLVKRRAWSFALPAMFVVFAAVVSTTLLDSPSLVAAPSDVSSSPTAPPGPPTGSSLPNLPLNPPPPPDPPSVGSTTPGSATTVPPTTTTVVVPSADDSTDPPLAVTAEITPPLTSVRESLPVTYSDGCHLAFETVTLLDRCVYGDPSGSVSVVLLGDSHAAQWFSPLADLAAGNGWRLENLTKRGCPAGGPETYLRTLGRVYTECTPWRANVLARVAELQPDLVVVAQHHYQADAAAVPEAVWRTELEATLQTLAVHARSVVLLAETPMPGFDLPACLARNVADVTRCTPQRSAAVNDAWRQIEVDAAMSAGVVLVDTVDWLCSATHCPPLLGTTVVYRDTNHLTDAYARRLEPLLGYHLSAALAAVPLDDRRRD
jgi:peptidoglycan/LPS O-acetylase OafA/YrhL